MKGVILALALLLPCRALAADCQMLATVAKGKTTLVTFLLCDGDHSLLPCGECDPGAGGLGTPDVISFSLEKTTGCTHTVNVRGLGAPVGVPYTYGALTLAGTSSIQSDTPRHTRFDATITTPGCTDVEVVGTAVYRRGN